MEFKLVAIEDGSAILKIVMSIASTAGLLFSESESYLPVQLVDERIVQPVPHDRVQIDDVTTVSLADLINMKLRSGSTSVLRSQDIADVVGLIRANKLTGAFTSKLDKTVRAEFQKLAKAVQDDTSKD